MPSSINLHNVKEIEIKEEPLFKDDNGNPISFVTDIIVNSREYGETRISLYASDKSKPITIKNEVTNE